MEGVSGFCISNNHHEDFHIVLICAHFVNGMVQWLLSPGGIAGECLPFNGTSGWVDIRLRTAVWPQAVTIEHIPQSLSFEPRSAPRNCTIWGWSASRRLHNGQVRECTRA